MPLTIGGKTSKQITEKIAKENRGGYPPHVPHGWMWHESDPEKQAGLCNDRAGIIRDRLNVTRKPMKRLRFLENAIDASAGTESPEREEALTRANQYRHKVYEGITEAILYESWGNWAWMDLSPDQRREYGCDATWRVDADRNDLIGIIWSWEATQETFGPNFDLKAFMGPIPNLRRSVPYRWDLHVYIEQGRLLSDPLDGPYADKELEKDRIASECAAEPHAKARKHAERKAAVIQANRDKQWR